MAKETEKTNAAGELSHRDRYRNRYKEKYPDLDIDNEDAFYEQANANMDDWEAQQQNNTKLIEAFDKNKALAAMLVAAKDGQDPFEWLAMNLGADINELVANPEYAKKISEAAKKFNENQAKGQTSNKEYEENMQRSLQQLADLGKTRGWSDEQCYDLASAVYDIIGNGLQGIITPETFEMVEKGRTFDSAVEGARAEGNVSGRNARIDERLRSAKTPSGMPPSLGSGQGQTPARGGGQSFFAGVK